MVFLMIFGPNFTEFWFIPTEFWFYRPY